MGKVFLIGIGGEGMNKLALLLRDFGNDVSGSDIRESIETRKLRDYGIKVFIGHNKNHISKDISYVIYSSAISPLNEELVQAKKLGIKTEKRGEALARIIKRFRNIAVAGTHGKTTTTAMIGHVLKSSGKSVNAYIGAENEEFNEFNKNADLFVLEADESDRTFLLLAPDILVVTNIGMDHLNAYNNSFEDLKNAFKRLYNNSKIRVVCKDDRNAFSVANHYSDKNTFFYSIRDERTTIFAKNFEYLPEGITFDFYFEGTFIKRGFVPAYGEKNVLNALSAITVAHLMGISFERSIDALKTFTMPHRRIEIKGEINGVTVIDDHADDNVEAEVVLKAVKKHFPNRRIITVFQPHRYSRVNMLREKLGKPFYLADIIITTDIYPAFEKPIEGINGELVNSWVKEQNKEKEVFYAPRLADALKILEKILKRNDLVVLLGSGDVWSISPHLLNFLKRSEL